MQFPSGTLTLIFTDLEGSSELSEKHGAAFEAARTAHFGVLREAAAHHHGYEVETAGDALFVVFRSASDAVQFAVEAQMKMAAHSWPSEFGELRVRIGAHTGEPYIGEDNGRPTFRGPVTNKAARVQAAGHGGQSLVSGVTRDLAYNSLPPEISFLDLGVYRLKGVGEERLWQIVHEELPREFPLLNALNPQRHNLPHPAVLMVGREHEIATWRNTLLDDHTRLLTLIGFGGMGKTRSALQLAELCVEDFSEGVWWIELEETRSAEAMLSRVALMLHLQPQAHLPIKEQLWNYLRERPVLLVFDNTEQNPDAAQVVAELLRETHKTKVLVTTRKVLGLRAEVLREVPPLPTDDAVRLFESFARTKLATFSINDENRGAVREICSRLEGVPLALELAASRIAGLAPRDILRHLDQRFKVLQTRSPDLPPRQRALRGAIDWSFDLLSQDDQSLFAQLAIFRRGFTLEDAEEVCETFDLFEGVQELRDQSLLRVETETTTGVTRFSMLESVREYAGEKLAALPEFQDLQRRHTEYFLRFAEAQISYLRSSEEAQALRRFENHLDNVRAASEWALKATESEMAARLFLTLGIFFQRRSLLNDAVCAIESSLSIASDLQNEQPELVATLWRERAGLHLDKNQPQEAQRCVAEAQRISQLSGDQKGLAEAYNLSGLANKRLEDYVEARQEFSRSLETCRAIGDEVGSAIAQTNLGTVECDDPQGDRKLGAQYLNAALELRRKQGDGRGVAEVLNNLGVLSDKEDRWDDAERFYLDALLFEQQLQNTVGVARVLINLCEIAERSQQVEHALRCALASDHLFAKAGSPLQSYASRFVERLSASPADNGSGTGSLSYAQIESKSLDEIVAWALEGR